MSDFPCDPLFEVCETETSPVTTEESTYNEMNTPDLEIEQYSLLWGGATAGMLALSGYYYF